MDKYLATEIAYKNGYEAGKRDAVEEISHTNNVVLPVKLGQKLYTIPRSAIREWTVAGVWISADPKCSYVHIYWEKNGHQMGSCAVNFGDISRCLFLSREEAEKALGERREGE